MALIPSHSVNASPQITDCNLMKNTTDKTFNQMTLDLLAQERIHFTLEVITNSAWIQDPCYSLVYELFAVNILSSRLITSTAHCRLLQSSVDRRR